MKIKLFFFQKTSQVTGQSVHNASEHCRPHRHICHATNGDWLAFNSGMEGRRHRMQDPHVLQVI